MYTVPCLQNIKIVPSRYISYRTVTLVAKQNKVNCKFLEVKDTPAQVVARDERDSQRVEKLLRHKPDMYYITLCTMTK